VGKSKIEVGFAGEYPEALRTRIFEATEWNIGAKGELVIYDASNDEIAAFAENVWIYVLFVD
jgi:hypothetical protein